MAAPNRPDDKSTRATRAVSTATAWLGSFPAILLSVGFIVAWVAGIPFVRHHFANNTYQLLINTGTTIVTFLMVFIIQNTQNRDGRAMQTKLDAQSEVLATIAKKLGCEDSDELLTRLVGVEDAPDEEIKKDQHEVRSAATRKGRSQVA